MSLQRDKSFTLKSNSYSVSFPTVDQFLKIENNKLKYSDGQYSQLVWAKTYASAMSLDLIDMRSTLEVLCPKLIEDLKCPIGQLDIFDSQELLDVFKSEVQPWIESWLTIFLKLPQIKESKPKTVTTGVEEEKESA